MATEFCPHCHRPMSEVIHGVPLPIFKAELFRFIETHPGQSGRDLARHFEKRSVKAHIWQINDALMNTNIRICGGQFTGYYVEKV
jgi:hypothetical protein